MFTFFHQFSTNITDRYYTLKIIFKKSILKFTKHTPNELYALAQQQQENVIKRAEKEYSDASK